MKITWKVSQVWLANWNGVTSFLHLVAQQQNEMNVADMDGFTWDTVRSHENVTWQKYHFERGRGLSKTSRVWLSDYSQKPRFIWEAPCARILANLKGGRKPLALARHTPGPILSSSGYSSASSSVFDEANLLVTIWRPRAGTRQEKLHLLPGCHLVQPFV